VLVSTERERDGASVTADVALDPNEAVVIEEAGRA
jgi:hypothetical protein